MTTQEVIKRIAELVARPSVSSASPAYDMSNLAVIVLLESWLKPLGFAVNVVQVASAPDKYNLIATAGSGDEGLILSGHTDTVPFDPERWTSDPLTLTKRDGCLYGLGVADMKCFFALALAAVEDLDLARLRQPLTILATADEESSMSGARYLTNHSELLPGKHVVIGEPTGLVPINRHKGVVWLSLRVDGRAGHASDPSLGLNAIEGIHAVIGELMNWRNALATRYADTNFGVPHPTMNFGVVEGGDNPNRICAQCTLQIDMRIVPAMTAASVMTELQVVAEQALAATDYKVTLTPLIDPVPALATSGDSPVVRFAEEVTGQAARTVAFGTEGPFFNALGKDTVILGPGDIAVAHQADEYLQIDRIEPSVRILRKFIEHFCLEG